MMTLMTVGIEMAEVASLIGDPGRANMLAAMLDGRAHTATELAGVAGISAPTASGHLAKLARGQLVSVTAQGRHRYYRLASAEVARILEGLMAVAGDLRPERRRATPRIDPGLRRARTCYDHIAGELGIAIADALVARGAVELNAEGATITESGQTLLAGLGMTLEQSRPRRRLPCCQCLDWTERRPHLGGVLGRALLDKALATGLLRRRRDSRALDLGRETVDDVVRGLGLR